jgi:hypothetical protein
VRPRSGLRAKSSPIAEKLGVDLRELRPLLRQIVLEEDCLDRTDLGTDSAVYTFIGINEILVRFIRRVDTVDRTDLDATVVLYANAWLGDYVRHDTSLPTRGFRAAKSGALGARF